MEPMIEELFAEVKLTPENVRIVRLAVLSLQDAGVIDATQSMEILNHPKVREML